MTTFFLRLEALLWQGPLLWALMGAHLYFTGRLHLVQRHVLRGIRLSVSGRREGGISRFGALSTTLAAAIGTGNIIGVATAVALGGPGAVLWCWLTGVLGMATRYAETYLCLTHRRNGPAGGPMYILEDLKKPGIARLFAFLVLAAALTTGAMLQTNAIGLVASWYGIPKLPCAAAVTALAALGIWGGARSVARLCQWLVPLMSGLYLAGCFAVLWVNRAALPEAVGMILLGAVRPRAVVGGVSGGMLTAARYGVARGLFTNEAGMGTAPMAAAAGPLEDPKRESLVAMTAVFWDTVVICGLTGLVVVSGLALGAASDSGLCWAAFSVLPWGGAAVSVCLAVFAFATVVGWCWYGQCGWHYLFGGWGGRLYQICYLASAFLGTFGGLSALWSLGSVLSGLLALPNLWCLWKLRGEIVPPDAETTP
jgi:AGCS family alanine or glycine:cation symporter